MNNDILIVKENRPINKDKLVTIAKVGETSCKCHPNFAEFIKINSEIMELITNQLKEIEENRVKL